MAVNSKITRSLFSNGRYTIEVMIPIYFIHSVGLDFGQDIDTYINNEHTKIYLGAPNERSYEGDFRRIAKRGKACVSVALPAHFLKALGLIAKDKVDISCILSEKRLLIEKHNHEPKS